MSVSASMNARPLFTFFLPLVAVDQLLVAAD
jgi:hypothetical protein